MNRTNRILILVCILTIVFVGVIASTPYFGSIESNHFSPYAACKKSNKSLDYAVFDYQRTYSQGYFSYVIIYSNESFPLGCQTVGIGPFWIVILNHPIL
jgi:hypothetical protein